MSHKTNPKSLRLGISQTWHSNWMSFISFSDFLHEDLLIRMYFINFIKKFGGILQNCSIKRSGSTIFIIVDFLMVRPNKKLYKKNYNKLILKFKFQNKLSLNYILEQNLQKLVKIPCKIKLINNYKKYFKLGLLKQFHLNTNTKNILVFIKFATLLGSSELLARFLALQIERSYQHKKIFGSIKQALNLKLLPNCLGVKIEFKGRLNGSSRKKLYRLSCGKVPLSTFTANIQYTQSDAFTKYGIIGIKVWIYCKYRLPINNLTFKNKKKSILKFKNKNYKLIFSNKYYDITSTAGSKISKNSKKKNKRNRR